MFDKEGAQGNIKFRELKKGLKRKFNDIYEENFSRLLDESPKDEILKIYKNLKEDGLIRSLSINQVKEKIAKYIEVTKRICNEIAKIDPSEGNR